MVETLYYEWTSPSTQRTFTKVLLLTYVVDPNYGADYDGNRGTLVTTLDNVEVDIDDMVKSNMTPTEWEEWCSMHVSNVSLAEGYQG